MRILLTGGAGFAGRHAAAVFRAAGHDVVAGDISPAAELPLDIRDVAQLAAAFADVAPDAVLHLGGLSFVPTAWDSPQEVFAVNTIGTLNVLAAVRRTNPAIRVLVVTSAEVYGTPSGPAPIPENAPLAPENLYGVSKAAADQAARLYAAHHHLDVMVARPANHIGSGQNPNFVVSSFASQLKAIAAGAEPRMRVGNLQQLRDFTDVRDVVRAYQLLIEKGRAGQAYTIASGQLVSIQTILDELVKIAGVHPVVKVDEARFRPATPQPIYDTARIHADTGWQPAIPLCQSLRDIYAAL